MRNGSRPPDTIVLIHGPWLTPRSWEGWAQRYAGRGYRVLAPAWPGDRVRVTASIIGIRLSRLATRGVLRL